MPVGSVAVLSVIFLAGGVALLRAGTKTAKRVWKFSGITLLLLCTLCILYLASALLLLGGIN